MLWLSVAGGVAWFALYMIGLVVVLGVFFMAQWAPNWLTAIIAIIGSLAGITLALWLFFLLVGRIAYVPQVMLVEGKRVFDSVGRSFSLARANVRRLVAMALFIIDRK